MTDLTRSFLSVAQAAERVGVGVPAVRQWISRGHLPVGDGDPGVEGPGAPPACEQRVQGHGGRGRPGRAALRPARHGSSGLARHRSST